MERALCPRLDACCTLLIIINVTPLIVLLVYTVEIFRFGASYKLVTTTATKSNTDGEEKTASSLAASEGQRQTRITVKRGLSIKAVAVKAVTHDKVVKLKCASCPKVLKSCWWFLW